MAKSSDTKTDPLSPRRLWGTTLPVLAVLAAAVYVAHLGFVHAILTLVITVVVALVIGVFVGLPAENARLLRDTAFRLLDMFRPRR